MNRFGDIDVSFKQFPPIDDYHSESVVSIEESLESIKPQIDQLSHYIKIAKEFCHYPSKHGLTKDQSAAIYIYTMEWDGKTIYRLLNQALRSEDRLGLNIWLPYIKLFNTALHLLPTVKESVWRGVSLNIGEMFVKDQILTWWSVNSCSSSVAVIERFLRNISNSTLFLIEVMNGKKIAGYTQYEEEDEIILPIGTRLRVKSNPLKRPDGSYTVHLIEIIENNDQETLTSAMNSMYTGKTPFANEIQINTKWKQRGITIAGGNGLGKQLDQLMCPQGIYVNDDHQSILIADSKNHRIVEWKYDAKNGQVIAGGNEEGNRINQLNYPTDVIVDQESNSLIICDNGNRRVVRWSREHRREEEIIVFDIDCWGLTIDKKGDLYVSDQKKHEVRRWKKGKEGEGMIVAGGNGKGNKLNQLNEPTFIYVGEDYSIYISDCWNHRVMKWPEGAKEGVVVAGGQGQGNSLKQLSCPMGVAVNVSGDVYVADDMNYRIMCWSSESKEGRMVVSGNGAGDQSNRFDRIRGLSFDGKNNIYVADLWNDRIQRFDVDQS